MQKITREIFSAHALNMTRIKILDTSLMLSMITNPPPSPLVLREGEKGKILRKGGAFLDCYAQILAMTACVDYYADFMQNLLAMTNLPTS